MISKRGKNKIALLMMILSVLVFTAISSCDKRSAVDPNSQQLSDINNILISLSPTQVHLSSPEAVDTVAVVMVVVDSEGNGVPGVTNLTVTRTPEIGFLTSPDSTNSQGVLTVFYITEPAQYGSVEITASVGDVSTDQTLQILGPSEYSLSLNYWPPVPKLIDHEGDPYTITALLVDTTQVGVGGQPVNFSILNGVGRLAYMDSTITTPRTSSEGMVSVLFYSTRDDEANNPTSVIIQAMTSSPGADSTDVISAFVEIPLLPVTNTLSLEATPSSILGDGSDSSIVRAILLDTEGHAIPFDTIRFRANPANGSIASAETNINGVAEATFSPFEGVSHLGLTSITAEYRNQTIHEAIDSVVVNILPVLEIGFINISLQKQTITANGEDSSRIFITVQDSSGGLIADGTTIYLEHTGAGFLSPTATTTTDGQAVSTIIAPVNIVGAPTVDSIFVSSTEVLDSTSIADTIVVNYMAGPIYSMQFTRPETAITLVAGSSAIDTIQVFAIDVSGNPVQNGTQIRLINELAESSIAPSSAPTEDGIATALYLVGSQTGDDNVRAFVPHPSDPNDTIWATNTVTYHCLSSEATTLVLTSSQESIEIGGASCQIFATLQDAYGNPLSEGYEVEFAITVANGNYGTGEWPSFDTEPGVYLDTIPTNVNGQSVVQIYSGTRSGAVSIRACTISDELFVCDEKSLITISSGPPSNILISIAGGSEASNPNTPERFVQIGALVEDFYANPVEYGTAVYFTLIPNNVALIEGDSYTGGARPYHPDSVNGVAFTRIIYGCFETFESLRVIASSAGDSTPVADTSEIYILPVYDAQVSVSANPGNLWCDGDQSFQCDESVVTALLTDGGGCAIEGGTIMFSAMSVGSILAPSIVVTDSSGQASATFKICGNEIPTPPDGVPVIEAVIRASLLGEEEAFGEISIICRRPQ